jgi:hypothetical protein
MGFQSEKLLRQVHYLPYQRNSARKMSNAMWTCAGVYMMRVEFSWLDSGTQARFTETGERLEG